MFTNIYKKIQLTYLFPILAVSLLASFVYSQTNLKSGVVIESIDSGGYTYLNVKVNDNDIWVAAPLTSLSVGDSVYFTGGMLMKNFTSPSLDRVFDEIYFTGNLFVGSIPSSSEKKEFDHLGTIKRAQAKPEVSEDEINAVDKIPGGKSIAEIQAAKEDLNGKKIRVKGIVTKYNGEIMNRNWLHLRDASTGAKGDDLVATTQLEFNVGDVVELEGTLVLDKNFGFGYKYAVLLEDATILK